MVACFGFPVQKLVSSAGASQGSTIVRPVHVRHVRRVANADAHTLIILRHVIYIYEIVVRSNGQITVVRAGRKAQFADDNIRWQHTGGMFAASTRAAGGRLT